MSIIKHYYDCDWHTWYFDVRLDSRLPLKYVNHSYIKKRCSAVIYHLPIPRRWMNQVSLCLTKWLLTTIFLNLIYVYLFLFSQQKTCLLSRWAYSWFSIQNHNNYYSYSSCISKNVPFILFMKVFFVGKLVKFIFWMSGPFKVLTEQRSCNLSSRIHGMMYLSWNPCRTSALRSLSLLRSCCLKLM